MPTVKIEAVKQVANGRMALSGSFDGTLAFLLDPVHRIQENRTAVLVQANDFPIEQGAVRSKRLLRHLQFRERVGQITLASAANTNLALIK